MSISFLSTFKNPPVFVTAIPEGGVFQSFAILIVYVVFFFFFLVCTLDIIFLL